MSQPEKKLDNFTSAVLKDAQEQRDKILKEIENYRKLQMEKAEEEILHDAYIMIQDEIAAIKNRQSREVSLAELDGRKKLLKLREDIAQKVFEETAGRIREYSSTAEYEDDTCKELKNACSKFPEGNLSIQVKKEDLRFADKLSAACGRKVAIEANSGIKLGGFILVNLDRGLAIDETLDLKLRSQKDWFASSSGLSLGM